MKLSRDAQDYEVFKAEHLASTGMAPCDDPMKPSADRCKLIPAHFCDDCRACEEGQDDALGKETS